MLCRRYERKPYLAAAQIGDLHTVRCTVVEAPRLGPVVHHEGVARRTPDAIAALALVAEVVAAADQVHSAVEPERLVVEQGWSVAAHR